MSVQQFLATLVANARKPGALKSIAGQLAIAYGSNLVMETAAAAEERAELANATAEKIEAATRDAVAELQAVRELTIAELHQHAVTAVLAGRLDDEVRKRAAILAGREPAVDAELLDDAGPPETIGAVRDLPGEEPAPPCVDPTCRLDYNHAGPHSPAIPPRMAGGYLSAVPDVDPADDDDADGHVD